MADKFIKYRSYNDKVLANELCRIFADNNIPFDWESTEGLFDVSFANNDILNVYYVRIRLQDFKKADELLMNLAGTDHSVPPEDYYLYSFSNDELTDVLKNPDEWNEFDRYWAKKILEKKGVDVQPGELQKAKEERITELKRPWRVDKVWILFAFALLMSTFIWFINIFGALTASFIAAYISFSKKTLPDGQRVKAFSPTDRLLGRIILIVGMALVLFVILALSGTIEFRWPL